MPSALARSRIGACLALSAAIAGIAGGPARAQGKLEARYTASLAGFPIGAGAWAIDIGYDQYTAAASGRVDGLLRAFVSGEGSTAARGSVNHGQLAPTSFAAKLTTRHDSYDVRMALRGGNVKELKADPPIEASQDRVPVTETHRRGVIDPLSAAIMPVPGSGEMMAPQVCHRRLPIFDGHQRFDMTLSFKRMDNVNAERGYQGPVVVCAATYEPVAGHRPERFAIKYLRATRDIEIWLAPIAGTRVLVPFRITIPTLLGTAMLEATQFETEAQPQAAPTSAAKPSIRSPRKL